MNDIAIPACTSRRQHASRAAPLAPGEARSTREGMERKVSLDTSPARILIRLYGANRTAPEKYFSTQIFHRYPIVDEFRYICRLTQFCLHTQQTGVKAWR